MNNDELLRIIGDIDDEWLTEAEKVMLQNKNFSRLVKLGLLAAATSFAFAAAVWMMYGRRRTA